MRNNEACKNASVNAKVTISELRYSVVAVNGNGTGVYKSCIIASIDAI